MQIAQIIGAIAILAGFFLSQRRLLTLDGYPYLTLNLAGSVVLALVALDGAQWGFLLLNTSWGVVTLWSLASKLRRSNQLAS